MKTLDGRSDCSSYTLPHGRYFLLTAEFGVCYQLHGV